MKVRLIVTLIILCCVVHIGAIRAPVPERPNIIFILADDLGYGEVGAYPANSPHGRMPTPNLDKFRQESMMFTDAYAGEAVCAPSRCALMTGLHTGHAYIRGNKKVDGYDLPLPSNYTTIANVLSDVGYNTALIGKWGMGYNGTEGHPLLHGFNYYYGQLDQTECHNYYPPYIWENYQQVDLPLNANNRPNRTFCMEFPDECTYTHDLFTNKTIEFLNNQTDAESPFFLYLAYTVPHAGGWTTDNNETGEPVPSDFAYALEQGEWPDVEIDHASMITNYLDRDIGRLMDLLKTLNLEENTVVFFASDNGAMSEGGHNYTFFDSSGPLRGYKRSLYEGGIRSPTMVRWPGKIPQNSTSDYAWAFWDFLPTAAEMAGVEYGELNLPYPIDGISILPTLLGLEQEPKEYLYWEFCYNDGWGRAVRSGSWKAVSFSYGAPFQLYDLAQDVGETNDLAGVYPKIVELLAGYASEAHVDSTLFPVENCQSCC